MDQDPLSGYRPGFWLRRPHLQTIASCYLPPEIPPRMGAPEIHDVPVAPGSAVRLLVDRPPRRSRGAVVMMHGLGGSAESALMTGLAVEAWRRGWTSVRMNYRNCGDTEHLSSTLYNAGMSGDLATILDSEPVASIPGPRGAVGLSLGGNILMKYLGEAAPGAGAPEPAAGDGFEQDGPGRAGRGLAHAGRGSRLAAAVAVCPPVDLSASARSLERRGNLLYHLTFVWCLLRVARQRHRLAGNGARPPSLLRTPTMRSYDTRHTAPDAGYASAEDYYRGASAAPLVPRIDTPTLVIGSRDDPIIPLAMLSSLRGANGQLRVALSDRGGHCGWLERRAGRLASRMPAVAMEFIERETAASRTPAPG